MKNLWLMTTVCLVATSCIIDSTGTGTYAPPPTSTGGDVPVGDSFPMGAVSYFRKLSCPTDWALYAEAAGRVIISASEGLPRGTTIGEPLSSAEEREHEHSISATVDVPEAQIAGIEGGGNDGMTPEGNYALEVLSGPAAASVPYVQLMTCKKTAAPGLNALPLPAKLQTYFDLDACPSGWKPTETAAGRIVVGLPPQAPADMPFGGEPIIGPEPRAHSHFVESMLATSPHGVALVSGCCGKFGKNGTYPLVGQATPASVDVPMLSLLHCEKE